MPKSTRRQFVTHSGAMMAASAAPLPAGMAGAANLLSGAYTPARLAAILLPREQWRPFPAAADRAAWEGLPPDARTALIDSGARQLNSEWPPLPATLLLGYVRTGNRSNYERVRGVRRDRLRELVIAECLEGQGRFVDDIVNGAWTTCEETFWGVPAHLSMQKAGSGLPDAAEPIVDLFAAETASLLAWTDYLVGPQLDKVSRLIRERIRLEVDRRILTPSLERDDFSWMGFAGRQVNNWNPWISSNWLTSALLLERDGKRRCAAVHKILRVLDNFLGSYHEDGGCDEGPGYWDRAGGSLFDCLELLHSASRGALDFYQVPLVQEIGRYIYRVHIKDNYFINFADASARVNLWGDLVFRYGQRVGDRRMEALGAFSAARQREGFGRAGSIGRQLPALFNLAVFRKAPASEPLLRDAWMPGIQVMAARLKEGSAEGLYLAAQGGHNAESHNHNDVGNFVVYAGGKPLFIDVGVETYTAKTFSSQRYEIWTMQSAYHNLPTIDGVMQRAGREYAASEVAYRSDDRAAEFSLNIARAYPPEAGLDFWKRTLRLDRVKKQVEVLDSYALKKPAAKITLSLMTPLKVVQSGSGELDLGIARLLYDGRALAATTEEIRVEDGRLRSVWGDRLYRIQLTAERPPVRSAWTLRIVAEERSS